MTLYVSGHCVAEVSTLTKISFSLLRFNTEFMTVFGMIHLYLAASGNGKTLARCAVAFNFSHDYVILSNYNLTVLSAADPSTV